MSLFIAELETRSFMFRAVGRTEAEARVAMKKTWNKHRKECVDAYGHDDFYKWSEIEDDVNVWEAVPGRGMRDWSVIA